MTTSLDMLKMHMENLQRDMKTLMDNCTRRYTSVGKNGEHLEEGMAWLDANAERLYNEMKKESEELGAEIRKLTDG